MITIKFKFSLIISEDQTVILRPSQARDGIQAEIS